MGKPEVPVSELIVITTDGNSHLVSRVAAPATDGPVNWDADLLLVDAAVLAEIGVGPHRLVLAARLPR